MKPFVAIDFETANEKRWSACSIGIAVVQDNGIITRHHHYIKPPEMRFAPQNINVHGITPAKIIQERAVTFDVLFVSIREILFGYDLWAHNAAFDNSVVKALCEYYQLPPVTIPNCTMKLAKRLLPESDDYRLPTICGRLGVTFAHHDAGDDAVACAHIVMQAQRSTTWIDPLTDPFVSDNDPLVIDGSSFGLVGSFKDWTTKEVEKLITRLGGLICKDIKRDTQYLIVGDADDSYKNNKRYTTALRLMTNGSGIRLVTEYRLMTAVIAARHGKKRPEAAREDIS